MILIAHRGNIEGPNTERENSPDYIIEALDNGFDVEIDVWYILGAWYLGHFEPQYKVELDFLNRASLWIHCKHYKALEQLITMGSECNFFYHTNEDYVLTSKNWIWAFPNKLGSSKTICVLPEYYKTQTAGFGGICSDYIGKYKDD